MKYPDTTLGNKIRRLREDRNISRAQMAEYLDISERTYEKIETGERSPNVDEVGTISKHLQVAPEDLLYHPMSITFNNSNNNAPFNNGTVHFQNVEEIRKLYEDLFQKERSAHMQSLEEKNAVIEQQRSFIEQFLQVRQEG